MPLYSSPAHLHGATAPLASLCFLTPRQYPCVAEAEGPKIDFGRRGFHHAAEWSALSGTVATNMLTPWRWVAHRPLLLFRAGGLRPSAPWSCAAALLRHRRRREASPSARSADRIYLTIPARYSRLSRASCLSSAPVFYRITLSRRRRLTPASPVADTKGVRADKAVIQDQVPTSKATANTSGTQDQELFVKPSRDAF